MKKDDEERVTKRKRKIIGSLEKRGKEGIGIKRLVNIHWSLVAVAPTRSHTLRGN